MENNESNSAADAESVAPQEHPADLAKHRSKILFETVVTRLGCGWGHAEFVKFFSARVSYQNIVDWRRGKARIPNWAWEYLEASLTTRAQTDLDYAKQCRKADRQRRVANIRKFNANRFAPQTLADAEKKKPAD